MVFRAIPARSIAIYAIDVPRFGFSIMEGGIIMQKFYASPKDTFTFPNGAIGYRPGGPFDCLGPYAKVLNCPIFGTDIRRACYATGYADTWFSIPACCRIKGKYIRGFFALDNGDIVFHPMDSHKHLIGA